eukprot:1037683-Pelagomonas_calceolata.AAC.11
MDWSPSMHRHTKLSSKEDGDFEYKENCSTVAHPCAFAGTHLQALLRLASPALLLHQPHLYGEVAYLDPLSIALIVALRCTAFLGGCVKMCHFEVSDASSRAAGEDDMQHKQLQADAA